MNVDKNYILSSINKLDKWIENNGWAGYDPYDIKELGFVKRIISLGNKNFMMEILREVIFEVFNTFPVLSRKIFKIKPMINAKAMALFSKAYLNLYLATGEEEYLKKSQFCISWLENNSSKTTIGIGWGYPFDWQMDVHVPKFTPNGIVTTAAGDAFWSWFQFTNNQKYLNVCKTICEFLISLPMHEISDDQVCFAYTPLYQNYIHNLNLFVAEYLIMIGRQVDNKLWINLGNKAVNYTIKNQREEGSFDYNGPPEKPRNFSDNYHTGFVLRMLHSIWRLTDRNDVFKSLEKCYYHYVNHFFEDYKIPKLLPHRKYRIDIHSCAESINCLCQLSETFPKGMKLAENIVNWTINNLQDETGYFYYGYYKSRFTKMVCKSKVAYLRWGQAWMLKGLSNYLIKGVIK